MARILARLGLLLAVLLMPFGMTHAGAEPPPHYDMTGMMMGHCSEQAPSHDQKAGFAECTMACAAALPAVDAPVADAPLLRAEPPSLAVTDCLSGLHPETATPPPKRS